MKTWPGAAPPGARSQSADDRRATRAACWLHVDVRYDARQRHAAMLRASSPSLNPTTHTPNPYVALGLSPRQGSRRCCWRARRRAARAARTARSSDPQSALEVVGGGGGPGGERVWHVCGAKGAGGGDGPPGHLGSRRVGDARPTSLLPRSASPGTWCRSLYNGSTKQYLVPSSTRRWRRQYASPPPPHLVDGVAAGIDHAPARGVVEAGRERGEEARAAAARVAGAVVRPAAARGVVRLRGGGTTTSDAASERVGGWVGCVRAEGPGGGLAPMAAKLSGPRCGISTPRHPTPHPCPPLVCHMVVHTRHQWMNESPIPAVVVHAPVGAVAALHRDDLAVVI